jgi:integrase
MTTTNYLSPEDFKKMVDAIPLVTEYNKSKLIGLQTKKVPHSDLIQAALYTQYCHGLRVSEVLQLHKDDFDFQKKILSLQHTKTGFKKCKCVRIIRNEDNKIIKRIPDKDCIKCEGKGKIRIVQRTSIPPDFRFESFVTHHPEGLLFPFSRQLIWAYVKKASKLAGLELGEQQDERYIEGAWTHLIRKSRAKFMIEKGASEVMVKVKLRHTFSVTERYTKPDINALIKWEEENLA